jgi:hypothetical protein
MDALSLGHRPVVVPRRAHLGEHVDDHQMDLSTALKDRVELVLDIQDLRGAIHRARGRRREAEELSTSRLAETVARELTALSQQRASSAALTAMLWLSKAFGLSPCPYPERSKVDEGSHVR